MCRDERIEEFDLCIVGAGMFGSAAARHASAHPSLKVCLIGPGEPTKEELKDREIFGAHYDEGRIVTSTEANEIFQTLNRESLSRFRELEKLSGIQFYTPSGSLLVFDECHEDVTRSLETMKPGQPHCVDLTAKELYKKRYPYLEFKKETHVFLDDMGAGYISPRKMVEAQKKVAHLQGCRLINDIVDQVKEPVNGFHEIVTENSGIIRAKRVLLSPGAFINFKQFDPLQKLKVILRKETCVFLRIPQQEAIRLSSMPTIITRNNCLEKHPELIGSYILPPIKYPDGKHYLKIGHIGEINDSELKTLEEVKEWYLSNGNKDVVDFYSSMLRDMIPGLEVEEIQGHTCVTSDSPRGVPYLDRITPTVTVAAVGNSRGAAVCEEVGRLAAQLSLTGKWDSKLSKHIFEAVYE